MIIDNTTGDNLNKEPTFIKCQAIVLNTTLISFQKLIIFLKKEILSIDIANVFIETTG